MPGTLVSDVFYVLDAVTISVISSNVRALPAFDVNTWNILKKTGLIINLYESIAPPEGIIEIQGTLYGRLGIIKATRLYDKNGRAQILVHWSG